MMIEMTTKRKPPIVTVASHFWIAVKAVVFVSFFICFIASFLYLSTMSVVVDDSPSSYLSSSYDYSLDFPGRIAFMFLVRSNVPLDFLWHTFFKNGDVEKFSIYIHSAQRLSFNQSTTRSHYFYNRQLKRTVDVVWGEVSMIEAEKLLLSTALNDLSNQRFILLSDSCVPLHNFTYIYNYVMSSSKSFVDSFGDEKDKRYSRKMSPVISKAKWRKGSQWFTLTRKHATAIAADSSILRIFQKHCKCVHCQVDPAIPKKVIFSFKNRMIVFQTSTICRHSFRQMHWKMN
ncbi:hypothetical protein ZOSMA_209G00120 [Zostera marina]|uniref:Core-2/I-branching beta-1,6-N-acetylglucosaminyltransferase familyprotein n=1 Tax=Zostera marina TaxID=29655 RepID=A0A0K9PL58_ZOSMR|nr:hypothetical protein ZOSMA_209G00120 [Zostera marina]